MTNSKENDLSDFPMDLLDIFNLDENNYDIKRCLNEAIEASNPFVLQQSNNNNESFLKQDSSETNCVYPIPVCEKMSIEQTEPHYNQTRLCRVIENDDRNCIKKVNKRGRPSKNSSSVVKKFKEYDKKIFQRFGNALVKRGTKEHDDHVASRRANTRNHREHREKLMLDSEKLESSV